MNPRRTRRRAPAGAVPESGAAPSPRKLDPRALRAAPFACAAIAFAVYSGTVARTITWWDGSSYPLAAVTLGIPGAPGSLVLTLLGWLVAKIPVVHPVAFRLNLFAALVSASLAGLVCWLGARLATSEDREPAAAERFAGAFAGLAFAFGVTPWTYAVQFTPYGLSALWTALILAAALWWWRRPAESDGLARLFVLFLLLGLDLSVHRTNLLLVPAALVWLALRSPAGRHRLRDGAVAVAGLGVGIAFHLLLIPLAARGPSYMVENPGTWAGWWSYVTIAQKGGGFLFRIFPRTANLFSVQFADYLAFLDRNLSPLLFLPALTAALGWLLILRHHPRRAFGLMTFFLCAGPGAVVYFNLPQHYMRPIDRHYLPSLVIMAPWMAVGASALMRWTGRLPARAVFVPGAAVILALAPLAEWRANHRTCDLSRNRFAETFARDLLEPLPARTILLTNGDNDSIPLWYLQQVERVRPDVLVVNLPLTNTGPYVAQLRRRDPDLVHLLAGEPMTEVLLPVQASDAPFATAVEPRAGLGLPDLVEPPDSVRFRPSGMLYAEDRVVLDILRLTRWKRPVDVACTVSPDRLQWLWPFARLDGLAYRIIPSDDPAVHDLDHFRGQLLRLSYAGVVDTTLILDRDSRWMCSNYLTSLIKLATAQLKARRPFDAMATLRFTDRHAPPARLLEDDRQLVALRAQIKAAAAVGSAE
ncbi:MAG TPA: DUF2723 domain-containing protein [Candidatus Eisenbacteria bacterium]